MENATSRSATVLWSRRKGNKVPLQFERPPRKIIHKKTTERSPAVFTSPLPPAEDREPARFREDMEQSQRNLEETYRLHEVAKAQERLRVGKKTVRKTAKRLAKRVGKADAPSTQPVPTPSVSNKPEK
jgi:hypothetical protein